MEGTMKVGNERNILLALLELLKSAKAPSGTIRNITKSGFNFIQDKKLTQISEQLTENIFSPYPVLNDENLNLELQIFLNWKKEYFSLTAKLQEYYKPLVLCLYLQSLHNLSLIISEQAEKDFEKLTKELKHIVFIKECLTLRNEFTPDIKESFGILKKILVEARTNYCRALNLLTEESNKIFSMIENMKHDLKHPMKGLDQFKRVIKESDVILPSSKFEILTFMKNNFSKMKTIKIEFSSFRDKCDYWIRAQNIQLNKNLLFRISKLSRKNFEHEGLKPDFLKNFFIPLFHHQTPKRILCSLSDEIQAIYNGLPSS